MKSYQIPLRNGRGRPDALVWIATLSAGQQGFKWWQSDLYKKELGLTAEQTRRMEEIFQKAMPQLKVQKSALDEAEAKFERLVEKGEDAAVMEQINVVEAARAELNKGRTLMLYGMRKAMTRAQWAKFTKLHQAAMQQATTTATAATAAASVARTRAPQAVEDRRIRSFTG
jgi:Spy/CpxP family protein refolding chaperone